MVARFWSVKRRLRALLGISPRRPFCYLCWFIWQVPCCGTRDLRNELQSICKKALQLLETVLLPNAEAGEAKTFYLKMQGDAWSISARLEPVRVWSAGSPVLFLSESHQIDLAQKTHSKSSRDVECGQVLLLASSYFQFIFNEPYFVLHLRHGLDFTALEHECWASPLTHSLRVVASFATVPKSHSM